MKQYHISKWLKGLVLILAVMGAIFFGGVTWFVADFSGIASDVSGYLLFFIWYTAVLCYAVLFQFWKVCNEIGRDNSFSLENAAAFHKMGILGTFAGIGYLARLISMLVIGGMGIAAIVYSIFMMCLSVAFMILCEALSQLIRNAYEVKQENELTI